MQVREVGPDPLKPIEVEEITDNHEDVKLIEKENRILMRYMTAPEAFAEDLQLASTEDFKHQNVSNVFNLLIMFEEASVQAGVPSEKVPETQKSIITESLEDCFSAWIAELNQPRWDFNIDYPVITEIMKITARIAKEDSIWNLYKIQTVSKFLSLQERVRILKEKYLARVSDNVKIFKKARDNKKNQKTREALKKFILKNPETYQQHFFYKDLRNKLSREDLESVMKQIEEKSEFKKQENQKIEDE